MALATALVLGPSLGVPEFLGLFGLDLFVALATIPIVKLDSNDATGLDDVNPVDEKKEIFFQWFVGFQKPNYLF